MASGSEHSAAVTLRLLQYHDLVGRSREDAYLARAFARFSLFEGGDAVRFDRLDSEEQAQVVAFLARPQIQAVARGEPCPHPTVASGRGARPCPYHPPTRRAARVSSH